MITTPELQLEGESPLGSDSCSGSLPESNLGCQHLKTWPKYFDAVERETKTFEIRQNDRPFMIGQRLVLHEYDPDEDKFTGRTLERCVTYMTDWEQKPGFVVLAIKPLCQNASVGEYPAYFMDDDADDLMDDEGDGFDECGMMPDGKSFTCTLVGSEECEFCPNRRYLGTPANDDDI